ncbi:methyltransferase [Nonomuraea antimicrobica]|uniref:Methyltransferase n=1 Tax=Nonomuraea antimicrobica TaxID=561173 RepID=A0ABP7DAE9_9ACTN
MDEITGPRTAGPPDRASVVAAARAYWAAKVLLSAVELGLFKRLGRGPAAGADIMRDCGIHPRTGGDFLDALVGLGYLEREGDVYANAPATARFFAEGPDSLDGLMRLLNSHFPVWAELTGQLRDGGHRAVQSRDFKKFYEYPASVERFMAMMDAASAEIGPALALAHDWAARGSFVDLGGARGNVAASVVRVHPHLQAGVADLPAVEDAFGRHMDRLGLTGKVRFHALDFFTDPLPEAEVMVLGHVLHDWNAEQCVKLLRRVHEALPPGGRVLIYDSMIDDERRDPDRLLLSINMKLITPGGTGYTPGQARSWLAEAGFAESAATPLTDSDTLVEGRKAG